MDRNQPITNYKLDLLNPLKKHVFSEWSVRVNDACQGWGSLNFIRYYSLSRDEKTTRSNRMSFRLPYPWHAS